MSCIYFHSPSGEAALRGSERAWLNHIATGPGTYAWNLDRVGAEPKRGYQLLAMSPEPPAGDYGANYLHQAMREAQAADATYKAACDRHTAAGGGGIYGHPAFNPEPGRKFLSSLRTALQVDGIPLHVAGHDLRSTDVELNTALVAGSDVVALAAKIDGWCESHCWVDGPDKQWMAGLIQQGLDQGIYRRGLWFSNTPDGPKDKWSDQGWGDVLALLRSRDDEPVVLSYSVCDQFPNREIADWVPPVLPDDWAPSWADNDEGQAEWDAYSATSKASARESATSDSWYDLPDAEAWTLAMAGLRSRRPWARLGPDTLRTVTFGPAVTVYDLFAPDRDERVARAFADEELVS